MERWINNNSEITGNTNTYFRKKNSKNGFSNSQFVYYLYQVTENSYRKIIDTWLEQKNLTLTRKKIYQYEVKTWIFTSTFFQTLNKITPRRKRKKVPGKYLQSLFLPSSPADRNIKKQDSKRYKLTKRKT